MFVCPIRDDQQDIMFVCPVRDDHQDIMFVCPIRDDQQDIMFVCPVGDDQQDIMSPGYPSFRPSISKRYAFSTNYNVCIAMPTWCRCTSRILF